MSTSLQKTDPDPTGKVRELEQEIALLERELTEAETRINVFTAQIRAQLQEQIRRIGELVSLYKNQKQEKKAKRQAQKKKGKNYREPQNLQPSKNGSEKGQKVEKPNRAELKRLFREAIVQVHPDKFATEEETLALKATELTRQLTELYQSGDLEELKGFHEHILSGNAMAHVPYQPDTVKDPAAMSNFLQRKRDELSQLIREIKTSELYHVLETYENPLTFIPELKQQFENRIAVFERRTRQNRSGN